MSNEVAEIPEKTTDLTPSELRAVEKFEADGMIGLYALPDVEIARMMELYLHGKTYREISMITNRPKVLVFTLSKKFEWYPKRMEYLRDLHENIIQRTLEAKIVGQDFLLKLKHVFEKKIGANMEAYLRTGNVEHINGIDLKEIDKYIKTLETLDKLSDKPAGKSGSKAPAVGINVGDGITMAKSDDGTVTISPKEKTVGGMLAQLAEARRLEEEKKTSDIKKNNSEGEKK